jgi:hypothetical protein
MPNEERDHVPISDEGETLARTARERLLESRASRIPDEPVAAELTESVAEALGFEAGKVSPELTNALRLLSEDLVRREPPPLGESPVPPMEE